jgi:hypothetical protein
MRLLFLTTLATAVAFAVVPVRAANLVTYDFDGDLSAETQSGVTASGFLGNGGSDAAVGLGDNDGSYGYILITKNSTSIGDSVDNDQFAQFTVTPPAKNGMQLAQIQFIAARGGNSTPRQVALRWSFDNYKSNLGVLNIDTTWPSKKNYFFNVNAFAGTSVTFRLYAAAKEISSASPSIRFSQLVVTGSAILYAPTVTPQTTFIKTTKSAVGIKGTAYDSSGISRVEVAKGSASGVYSGANGTTNWFYKAANLKNGKTIYYVRSIDNTGDVSAPVKVTVQRTKKKATPSPTP